MSSGKVQLEVADTGVGIAKADHERIFEAFHQVDGAISTSAEGTGLGLALVTRLLAPMGGALTVQSETGKGSTF